MRILFDSKKKIHKEPFGCLVPGQMCTLRVHIPESVGTKQVEVLVQKENGTPYTTAPLTLSQTRGVYQVWAGSLQLPDTGLYFYYFRITGNTGSFRLFKQGNDTNMEAGDLWQVSCIPADFTTPDWAKGAMIYQVFPDRYFKSGECDLTGKLQPYVVHKNWDEEVFWQPTAKGEVLNNDFYGGNFRGITEKMDTLAAMGVNILYLNPISKSFSSHRYDTGDYKTPDPMLGTEADFEAMCDAAHERGIRVVLDGVYSHTGSNSLYFDRERTFGGQGAYCSKTSPYYSWYTFKSYPNSYNCWWNFDTLPTVNKMDPAFMDYIIDGEDSVVAHWLNLGADGFRLDVADELPNEFMDRIKKRIRQLRPDALLIGEVWEDASNKIAYDVRRRYFVDGTLDSVMNYPFRTAILNFMRRKSDAGALADSVMTVVENYPRQVLDCNMNLLGTHDTPRILTALVDEFDGPREALAQRRLTPAQREKAKEMLLMASVLQFSLPGSPSVYYGDEAGMEGGKDPFNRRTYPWGKEDKELWYHHRSLGRLRRQKRALALGDVEFTRAEGGFLAFKRTLDGATVGIYVNRTEENRDVPAGKLLLGHNLRNVAPDQVCLAPMGWCILEDL